jgi:hypothetical protein
MKFDNEILKEFFYTKDGILYNKVNRHKNPKNSAITNKLNSDGYMLLELKGKYFKVHRVIFYLVNGWMPEEVDHIDGDRNNNHPDNLRAATHQQNSYNSRTHRGCSGVKGVSKAYGKWRARLCVNGKRISLGLFDSLELAELVVSEARDKYHGEFGFQY